MDQRAARMRTAMDALYYSGAWRAIAPVARGRGLIFMLHRVLPGAKGTRTDAFDPNGFLAVTPEFLDLALRKSREAGLDLVDLDEAALRLRTGEGGSFACFTLDDGYRDNRDHALPVFERHDCPLTVYVASGFASRTHAPWWVMVERVLGQGRPVCFAVDGVASQVGGPDIGAQQAGFERIAQLYNGASGDAATTAMSDFAARNGVDIAALAAELTMGWDELDVFTRHPLVTLGAHTVSHPVLAALDTESARREFADGADTMERHLGYRPRHGAYPYGHDWAAGPREFELAADLGFATAVTTRKGVLFGEHGRHLTALPRVSLNGDYQLARYLDVLISGTAFALLNRFRRVNAA